MQRILTQYQQNPSSAATLIPDRLQLKMTECDYDCIVVGAGVEGSAAAFKIAQSGKRTLLLEQFDLLNTNGSSHGGSRITRHAYREKCFAELTKYTFEEWNEIEQLSGQKLFVNTGLVWLGTNECPELDEIAENLRGIGVPHKTLNHDELLEKLPSTVFPETYHGVFDNRAGVLLASKAVNCLHELFLKFGGEIRTQCTVENIQPGSTVTVLTNNGTFKSKGIVLCPGTWAGQLTSKIGLNLPIKLVRCFVLYWKEKVPGTYSAENGFPCFIDCNGFYGIPSLEHPGYLKSCNHGGYTYDIDNLEAVENEPPFRLDEMSHYVGKHFPGLESTPSFFDKCKYTMSPDELFIIDRHPQHNNIVIGTGFSGTGFKMAPVIGNILRDLFLNVTPKHDITPFRISRF